MKPPLASPSSSFAAVTGAIHPHPHHHDHLLLPSSSSSSCVLSSPFRFAFSAIPVVASFLIVLLFAASSLPAPASAVKCQDCVGPNCMGTTCEGDYCLISHYAPRWGTMVWGPPDVVKGCLSGQMLRADIRSHCEIGDDERSEEPLTCFCNGRNFCNADTALRKLEIEPVPIYSCVCRGPHCRGKKTCQGEMCTYVLNRRSKASEQGCVNASVPLVERRAAGACMIPPITGAMHHTVAKSADDLLYTESCVCEGDFCNSVSKIVHTFFPFPSPLPFVLFFPLKRKPKPTAPERAKCNAFVHVEVMGQRMSSKNVSCTGEFCFRAEIRSKIGHMSKYQTMGCASFTDDSKLAEELKPTGCATFDSEKVQVEACFQTKDKAAIARARESQQRNGDGVGGRTAAAGRKGSRTRGRPRSSEQQPEEELVERKEIIERIEIDELAEGADEKEQKKQRLKPSGEGRRAKQREVEGEEAGGEEGEVGGGEEQEAKNEADEVEEEEEEKQRPEKQDYIFEPATLAPEPDESTNSTLIFVFLLLILLILLSGVVWKFQLHKRLFRANYDTVAGG